MTVRQMSIRAYQGIQTKLGEKQRALLDVLKNTTIPLSNKDVARILRWPLNTVTPRMLELRVMGRVVCAGIARQDGENCFVWSFNEEHIENDV